MSNIDLSTLVEESARRYHNIQKEARLLQDGTQIPEWHDMDEEHRVGMSKVAYAFISPVARLIYDDIVASTTAMKFEDLVRGIDVTVDLTPHQPHDILKSIIHDRIEPHDSEID